MVGCVFHVTENTRTFSRETAYKKLNSQIAKILRNSSTGKTQQSLENSVQEFGIVKIFKIFQNFLKVFPQFSQIFRHGEISKMRFSGLLVIMQILEDCYNEELSTVSREILGHVN